jgi:single-strand DNA-binding protein
MSSVNKVILIGRLGKDPELKTTPAGQTVCSFSLATSETWKDKNGQKQEKTDWHNINAWGKLGEIAGQYLQKGREVYLEGRISTQTWEKDGEKKYKTIIEASDIKFLSGKESGSGQQSPALVTVNEDLPF